MRTPSLCRRPGAQRCGGGGSGAALCAPARVFIAFWRSPECVQVRRSHSGSEAPPSLFCQTPRPGALSARLIGLQATDGQRCQTMATQGSAGGGLPPGSGSDFSSWTTSSSGVFACPVVLCLPSCLCSCFIVAKQWTAAALCCTPSCAAVLSPSFPAASLFLSRHYLEQHGVSMALCVETADLVALVQCHAAAAQGPSRAAAGPAPWGPTPAAAAAPTPGSFAEAALNAFRGSFAGSHFPVRMAWEEGAEEAVAAVQTVR